MMAKFFILALLLASVAVFANAQGQTGGTGITGNSIGGHVFDTARRPVSNLQVELQDDVGYVIARTRTNNSGRYLFNGLNQGWFTVTVVTAGTSFVSQSVRLQLVNVSVTGRSRYYEEYNFTLKSEAEEKSRNAAAKPDAVFAQNVPEAARKLYEDAAAKLDNGRESAGAVEQLKQALELFPEYYLALERLGSEYVRQRQYALAMEPLSKAVLVNSKGAMSYYAMGIAQYNLKRADEAIESLRRAVTLTPDSVNAQLWLGIVLVRTAAYQQAEAPLQRAYALGGKQIPDVHMYLAQVYSNTKRYKEAITELELFLKEAPDADKEKINAIIQQLRSKAK